jgi:hypothetical protein
LNPEFPVETGDELSQFWHFVKMQKLSSSTLSLYSKQVNWFCEVIQIEEWISPLCFFRRRDRKIYMDRLIWSPDEGIVHSQQIGDESSKSRFSQNG